MRFADFLEQIRPVLGEVAETVLVFEHLPSTNDYARHLLAKLPVDALPPDSFVLAAFEQTAGRGRRGRRWAGPPGGLYLSWVVALDERASRATLPLLAASSICGALRSAGAEACEVKWPNDLMVRGRKMGGILIEVVNPGSGRRPMAIIGCGINVETDPSERLGVEATTLAAESEEPIDFGRLLVGTTRALDEALDHLDDPEFAAARYREVLAHRPGEVVRCSLGDREVEGEFVDIDGTGALRLATDRGERTIGAGEVVES